MTATTRQYTIDEFIQYAATHGRRELIRREIRDLSLSGERHGEVTGLLHAIIGHYVVEHRLGKVFTAETGYRFDEDGKATVRAPDFAFKSLAWAKGPSNISFGRIPPEFVVEVLSPSDRASEVAEKVKWWLDHKVRLVWVVDPENQTVTDYDQIGNSRIYRAEQIISTGNVIPGFSLRVADLFN